MTSLTRLRWILDPMRNIFLQVFFANRLYYRHIENEFIICCFTIFTVIGGSPYLFYESNDSDPNPDESDDEYFVSTEKKNIPDEVLWKMFHTGVSFRTLSIVLKAAFDLTNKKDQFYVSAPHLFKQYQRILRTRENEYKDRIREDKSLGSICFDHQKMKRIEGKREGGVDRLAVVWHAKRSDYILGISKMPDKRGESQATAIQISCEDHGIDKSRVVALVCDNAAPNVGSGRGTCVKLEVFFDKKLLRLMCRHHISEIVIKDVYHHLFATDTPNNLFYPILKDEWTVLRENNFPFDHFDEGTFTENMDSESLEIFVELRLKAVCNLKFHSRNGFVRDDYKDITELALKFLQGGRNALKANQSEFHSLIDPSNARFMATCIQSLKCYLFRNSLNWDSPERAQIKENLDRFCVFVSTIYVSYWNRTSNLFDAPLNDLNFLQDIQQYKSIDETVANKAIAAMNRHLYYMSEELAPLSLFSSKISNDVKNMMREKFIHENTPPRLSNSNHVAFIDGANNPDFDWNSISVVDLIGPRSNYFFEILNIEVNFLRLNANEWDKNSGYISAKKTIEDALVCVNDCSERVISKCKSTFKRQRCRKESTFRSNIVIPKP